MTVKENLNKAQKKKKAIDAMLEFWAQLENVHGVIKNTVAKVDEIAASPTFSKVCAEIKAEGRVLRKTLNDVQTILDAHKTLSPTKEP